MHTSDALMMEYLDLDRVDRRLTELARLIGLGADVKTMMGLVSEYRTLAAIADQARFWLKEKEREQTEQAKRIERAELTAKALQKHPLGVMKG